MILKSEFNFFLKCEKKQENEWEKLFILKKMGEIILQVSYYVNTQQ